MSGINPPPLADLKKKIEAQGVPVTIKDAKDVIAETVDPAVAAASAVRLADVMATPSDVPVKHTQIDAEKRHEEVTPATVLDPDFAWFFLGFAYTLIPGLDRSLIEVYQAAGGKTIPVRTHRATAHIAEVNKANFAANPWAWLIQGIPREHADPFREFVASYRFKAVPGGTASAEVTHVDEQLWRVDWIQLRIGDTQTPAGVGRRGVDVSFALPANETTKRGLQLIAAPGLMLRAPMFAVQGLA